MKILIAFLFSLLFLINLYPQSEPPLQLNKNFLVNSAGLPEEFLLFAPDSAVQILFNPARGNNYKSSFIYINYLSDNLSSYYASPAVPFPLSNGGIFNFPMLNQETFSSSKNPTFSVVSLFKSGTAKWLLSFSNGLNNRELQNYNIDSPVSFDTPINQIRSMIGSVSSKQDQSLTTLKLSSVWGNEITSYSIGVFGIMSINNSSSGQFSNSSYLYSSHTADTLFQWHYNENIGKNLIDVKNKKYAAGVEFSAAEKDWDYIGSVNYQWSYLPSNFSGMYNYFLYDSSSISAAQLNSSSTGYFININGQIDGNLNGMNFNNFFRHNLNLINSGDNFFISLNAFYSAGSQNFSRNTSRISIISSSNNISRDTVNENTSGTLKSKNWRLDLSCGYAVSISLSDINILTGFRLRGNFNYFENVTANLTSGYSTSFFYIDERLSSAAFTLPVYLNYSPEKWISIYGGLNYSYYYFRDKPDNVNDYIYYSSSSNSNSKNLETTDRKTIQWQSAKSIYAGFELRHKSGLKLQFYFDEDFALIRDWNVSIGYCF